MTSEQLILLKRMLETFEFARGLEDLDQLNDNQDPPLSLESSSALRGAFPNVSNPHSYVRSDITVESCLAAFDHS